MGLIGPIALISPISAGVESSLVMTSKKMYAAILFIVLAVVSAAGGPRQSQGRSPATQSPPSALSSGQQKETSDGAARRQAYVRFIEARRLRGEIQRLRNSARLLDEAIKA